MSSATTPAELDTPEFREAWQLWRDYRKESGLKWYKPIGERTQLNRLAKEFGHDRAIHSIHYSIAQGYQGIFADRHATALKALTSNPRTAQSLNNDPGRYAQGPGVLGNVGDETIIEFPNPGGAAGEDEVRRRAVHG